MTDTQTRKQHYWCHECRDWKLSEHDEDWGPWWYCLECGTTIKCDECGQDWTDDHPAHTASPLVDPNDWS